jgi:hypothetical protein
MSNGPAGPAYDRAAYELAAARRKLDADETNEADAVGDHAYDAYVSVREAPYPHLVHEVYRSVTGVVLLVNRDGEAADEERLAAHLGTAQEAVEGMVELAGEGKSLFPWDAYTLE